MDNATTKAVVDSFFAVLNREPAAMRKTMTYDQVREMHGNQTLTEHTDVQIYFADPDSPWQRGSNENTNGLLRHAVIGSMRTASRVFFHQRVFSVPSTALPCSWTTCFVAFRSNRLRSLSTNS